HASKPQNLGKTLNESLAELMAAYSSCTCSNPRRLGAIALGLLAWAESDCPLGLTWILAIESSASRRSESSTISSVTASQRVESEENERMPHLTSVAARYQVSQLGDN